MKKTSLLSVGIILLTMTVFAVGCKRYETVSGDPLQTKIYTLDNGLKIFMSVNKEQPRIQTYIAVKVGSKNDPSETTGLAHYFEHLMFKGSEHFGTVDYAAEKPMLDEIEQLFEVYRKTTDEAERAAIYHRIDSVSYEASKLAIPNEYDKLMALIGASGTNAWTSKDETVYVEDIPSNQIDNWARIQADRFRHGVIRGFHTELEAIYEEKNMSLTEDSDKAWEALNECLFKKHPYGLQTTLGSQEHLRNPSITNVKTYHDVYYVPNNIAICVAGDFNPDEMVATIKKYFGDWEPNPEIPTLKFEAEDPITAPIEREVYGQETENLLLAWRLPAPSDLKTAAVATIADNVFCNGTAGLLDIDILQQQKMLDASSYIEPLADYSEWMLMATPKQGQSLEEARDLLLQEVARLRSGDFDESLISSTINNLKLAKMGQLERNAARARSYVSAFIHGIPWKDAAKEIDRLETVTKEDVVAYANKYLGENAYAVIYKRQGEDTSIQKVAAPKITPIVTNRDRTSAFLDEIQSSVVKPIEPVYVDFAKDMSVSAYKPGAELLYKQNKLNDIFTLALYFNRGTQQDPALALAMRYLGYLGTPEMSAEEIASKMYALACNYGFGAAAVRSNLYISGLGENLPEALRIVEDLIRNAVPDEAILANLKADMLKDRADSKLSQVRCFSAMRRYVAYGPEFIKSTTLTNEELMALTSEQLLAKVREAFSLGHNILYYGPMSENELKGALDKVHYVAEGAQLLPAQHPAMQQTPSDRVILAQYDAPQLIYFQYSDDGKKFDVASTPEIELFNEYFGGSMNAIVFQEMREARGLAYNAAAFLNEPDHAAGDYSFIAYIATQNDKMRQATEAFQEIINDMPESEAAFSVARDAILSRLRTQRITGANVLSAYMTYRELGLDAPTTKAVFDMVSNASLSDVVAAQQKWVKGRTYTYSILGDIKNLDTQFLSTLGPVQQVSLEEIFGY